VGEETMGITGRMGMPVPCACACARSIKERLNSTDGGRAIHHEFIALSSL